MRSEFALAANLLDPEFHNRKPWENAKEREALINVSERLLYPLVGDALDSKLREVGLGLYAGNTPTNGTAISKNEKNGPYLRL